MFNQPYFVIMYDVHMLFSSTHQSNINAISRPDFLIIKYHDPSSTDSFSRLRKINLKSSQMPTDIAQTLQNPSLKKMCWDAEATQAITHSLLSEAGICYNHFLDDYVDVKELLHSYGYTCRSLTQIAKQFKLPVCPKANVRNPTLLTKRFQVLNAVIQRLVTIDGQNLFDGILI